MKNKHFYSVVHFTYSVLQSTTVLHVSWGIPIVLLFIFISTKVKLITSASMGYGFLGFARKDCTMMFWVQKMRLGVCISVYRIEKKGTPWGRYFVWTVVCFYENVEDSMFFKSVCIGRLSMHGKYIQLYAVVCSA